ncbi:MAG: hypothetical protein IJE09_04585 [Oscillospiraceae bacterium]|nr:hypothetical protein [Oscillospiraceae bacterium]
MNRKKRIEYLLVTLCVFITGFFIYGFLGMINPLVDTNKLLSFLYSACLGGFGFSMLLSTIILSVNFFSKKKLAFKITAAILWPITVLCTVYLGIICYFPYQIYNIVKIVGEKASPTQEP